MKKGHQSVFEFCRYFLLAILILSFSSCRSQQKYDPALMTPDIDAAGMNHGYNLTPLGRLLGAPWQVIQEYPVRVGFTETMFYNKTKISSLGVPYSGLQKNLVFELQRDSSLKYWLKSDYIKSPDGIDTLADGTKINTHNVLSSTQLQLKKIYVQGSWMVNFKDSTIKIDFGKNNLGLVPINAKYTRLAADEMILEQIFFIDKMYNGKLQKLKKVTSIIFEH